MKPSKQNELCTEIILQPDGRIFVHGLSREVLDILADLQPHDPQLLSLIQSVSLAGPRAGGGGGHNFCEKNPPSGAAKKKK
jgi:hypothetical protein